MSWIHGLSHRLRTLLRPDAHAAELEEEIKAHLEFSARDLRDEGFARRLFGNELGVREATRNQTWIRFLDAFRQDLGTALRSLRRSPTTTGLAILTLALGIGANSITFSLLDRVFVRPPSGVEDPGSLRRVWIEHAGSGDQGSHAGLPHSYPLYAVARAASDDPASTAAYLPDNFLEMGRDGEEVRVNVTYATANYFPVLGVRPMRGRLYSSSEDSLGSGAPVAVVSESFWRMRMNARDDAIGSTLVLGKNTYEVIGIMGEKFTGIELQEADLWVPLAAIPEGPIGGRPWWESMNRFYALRVVHRLGPHEDPMQLEARATGLHRARARAQKPMRADTLNRVLVGPIVAARGPSRGEAPVDQDLIVATRLGGVAFIILLITWANVVNLLLARATQRSREMAVRLALGMSRGRLARLLSVEALLVAITAASLAAAIASAGGAAFRVLLLPDVKWGGSVVDGRVVVFTLVVAAVSAAVSILPVLRTTGASLQATLKSSGNSTVRARRSRLRQGMLVVQAALSVTLLVGAGLFLKSLRNVESLDLGFDARRIVMGSVTFATGEAPPDPVWTAGIRLVAERMRAAPGVDNVAQSSFEPMRGLGFMQFYTDRDSSTSFSARFPSLSAVSPEYFAATGLSLMRGTGFSGGESGGAGAEVVVNDAMARLVWPAEDAVGRCLYFVKRSNPCYRVVGVVENARQRNVIESEPSPQYYVPVDNEGVSEWTARSVLIRADASLQAVVSQQLTRELLNVFPRARPRVRSMMQNLEPQYRPWRLGAVLLALSGGLALMVALIGVYGSLSHTVGQRTREFGIRRALGARSLTMIGEVLGAELRVVCIGLAIGIGMAVAGSRLASQLLYDVRPFDPMIIGGVTVLVLVVASVAALRPALRASRVDPSEVLREE